MPVRASVVPLAEPGHAVLRLSELDAVPEGLALSIQRQQGPDTHLADDGWRRTEAWLMPDEVTRKGDVMEFHLGPEICDRLAGIATIRLRVKEPDIGVVGTTVVAWPTMLTSGAAGASGTYDDTVRLRRMQPAPSAEPAPEALPPPFEPPAGARIARGARARSRRPATLRPAQLGDCRDRPPHRRRRWLCRLRLLSSIRRMSSPRAAARHRRRRRRSRRSAEESIRDTVADYLATKPAPTGGHAGQGPQWLKAGDTASASWCSGAQPSKATPRPSSNSPPSTIR
jgi:hypothetical protein